MREIPKKKIAPPPPISDPARSVTSSSLPRNTTPPTQSVPARAQSLNLGPSPLKSNPKAAPQLNPPVPAALQCQRATSGWRCPIRMMDGAGGFCTRHLNKVMFCQITCMLRSKFNEEEAQRLVETLSSKKDGVFYVQQSVPTPEMEKSGPILEELTSKSPQKSYSEALEEIDHEELVSTSLRASVANPTLLHQFKCVVRVVSACPWRAEDLLKFKGKYKVRLTMEDPTARIHAFIVGEDGVNFFGDNPECCVLEKKMNILLGIPDGADGGHPGSRNPPWVLCCLNRFYRDKSDPWGTTTYRISGTRLVV